MFPEDQSRKVWASQNVNANLPKGNQVKKQKKRLGANQYIQCSIPALDFSYRSADEFQI
jgi:hypothetical protein